MTIIIIVIIAMLAVSDACSFQFENLPLVCILMIEVFQSSIAFTFLSYEIPKELGGPVLAAQSIAAAGRATPGGGAGSLPRVEQVGCHLRLNC